MTDDTARAENYAADRCVDCGELTTNRIHHEERLSAYHDANVSLAPARPSGLLREAAERLVDHAETDDDFDGQYTDFLVPADDIERLRAALAATGDSEGPGDVRPEVVVERLLHEFDRRGGRGDGISAATWRQAANLLRRALAATGDSGGPLDQVAPLVQGGRPMTASPDRAGLRAIDEAVALIEAAQRLIERASHEAARPQNVSVFRDDWLALRDALAAPVAVDATFDSEDDPGETP